MLCVCLCACVCIGIIRLYKWSSFYGCSQCLLQLPDHKLYNTVSMYSFLTLWSQIVFKCPATMCRIKGQLAYLNERIKMLQVLLVFYIWIWSFYTCRISPEIKIMYSILLYMAFSTINLHCQSQFSQAFIGYNFTVQFVSKYYCQEFTLVWISKQSSEHNLFWHCKVCFLTACTNYQFWGSHIIQVVTDRQF